MIISVSFNQNFESSSSLIIKQRRESVCQDNDTHLCLFLDLRREINKGSFVKQTPNPGRLFHTYLPFPTEMYKMAIFGSKTKSAYFSVKLTWLFS